MKLLLSLLLSLVLTNVYAQATEENYAQTYMNDLTRLSDGNPNVLAKTIDTRYEGTKGSAFLLPDWNRTDVLLFGGKSLKNLPLKYNLVTQQLVWHRPQGDSIVLDSRPVAEFALLDTKNNQVRTFRKMAVNASSVAQPTDDFYEVLHAGPTLFLARREKALVHADYRGAFSADRRYDELVDRNAYFIQKPAGELIKIKLGMKAILEALSDHKAELENYLRQHQKELDFSQEAGVLTLVRYYDSL